MSVIGGTAEQIQAIPVPTFVAKTRHSRRDQLAVSGAVSFSCLWLVGGVQAGLAEAMDDWVHHSRPGMGLARNYIGPKSRYFSQRSASFIQSTQRPASRDHSQAIDGRGLTDAAARQCRSVRWIRFTGGRQKHAGCRSRVPEP